MKKNKPIYSETTLFWGAGATAELGAPTTVQTAKSLHKLADTENLLIALKDSDLFNDIEKPLSEFLENLEENKTYKNIYDWEALKGILEKIPFDELNPSLYLQDIYNVIDGNLLSKQGFMVIDENKENMFLNYIRLQKARNTLGMLNQCMFVCAYHNKSIKKPQKIKQYADFAETLGILMQEEGDRLSGFPVDKPQFYLESCAHISTNYDPVLQYIFFQANKKLNDNPPCIGKSNRELKLFLDYSVLLGLKQQDGAVRYSVDESVLHRLNPEQHGKKVIRIGKYFLPHGCINFRECENCGKVTAIFGNQWSEMAKDLYNPLPFKNDLPQYKDPDEDRDDDKDGYKDGIKCPYCENTTLLHNAPTIYQTSYKGSHTAFLEEIQRNTKTCLVGTKHIVLMGYQLPPDDVVWRSAIMSKINKDDKNKKYCSVVVGSKGEDRWIEGGELRNWVNAKKEQVPYKDWSDYGIHAIDSASAIFGKDCVRAYTGGIPNVYLSNGVADRLKIEDLLYPKNVFPTGIHSIAEMRKG
ncbi:hypothetical protein AGMMS49938_06510 [Fibrobacterales bacterium]|nr:hypothetical protein AGMMS49938_06510 [Fibrobacterales bacterium]